MGKKVVRIVGELRAGHKDEGGEFGTFPCPTSEELPPQKIANTANLTDYTDFIRRTNISLMHF
jgi:hypothetical protein